MSLESLEKDLDKQTETEKLSEQLLSAVEEDLKELIGEAWEKEKVAFKKWAVILAKIQLAKLSGSKNDENLKFAYSAIDSIKARVQSLVESRAWDIAERMLRIVSKVAINSII